MPDSNVALLCPRGAFLHVVAYHEVTLTACVPYSGLH
jgi:hypothetical protein